MEFEWLVYDDENRLVARVASEKLAWLLANAATADEYIDDGCYYVERDVKET